MGTMDGVRVVEVASWTFVPAAGAVLADWGADVLKIEHPVTGDPQRALITSGLLPEGTGVNFMIEFPNRGKRSVGMDLANEDGRELLYRLCETADVFLTSFRPEARQRLGIDLEDIRAANPGIVYARGTGQGVRGPDADRGGYDAAAFWARGAIADSLSPPELEWPIQQTAAFGDLIGAQTIAGGIAAALFERERTGEAPVVDISLLGTAMWIMSPGVIASDVIDVELKAGGGGRGAIDNPLVGPYKTADERVLMLVMLQSERYWAELCGAIDRPDLIDDDRFVDAEARGENSEACMAELDEAFASRTLEEWKPILREIDGVWAPVQSQKELLQDPQALANDYVAEVEAADGEQFRMARSPVQFDEEAPGLSPAPEHGQHTEEVLLDLGLSWEELAPLKEDGAIT